MSSEAFKPMSAEKVDFTRGYPSLSVLDRVADVIATSAAKRLAKRSTIPNEDLRALQYGAGIGNDDYLKELAAFLSRQYGSEVNKSSLFATAGASSGLHAVVTTLFPRGCPVFVEDASYHCTLIMFADLACKIIPVPITDSGMNFEELEAAAIKARGFPEGSNSNPWGVIYANTVYQNPTGMVYSEDDHTQLIQLARRLGLLVVNDDVYNLLNYSTNAPPKRSFSFDSRCFSSDKDYTGTVISNGSFTKYLAPGLRVGWLEAPEWVLKRLTKSGLIWSGGAMSHTMSGIVASALQLGLVDESLAQTRAIYKERAEQSYAILKESLGPGFSVSIPQGGYFIWIWLPDGIDAERVAEVLEPQGIVVAPGAWFCPKGHQSSIDRYRNCIRICFSYSDKEILLPAIRRLAKSLKDICDTR